MQKLRVGIIGATGMVGQRFALLLKDHPWFNVTCVAASARSAGKTYAEAVEGRWAFKGTPVPENIGKLMARKHYYFVPFGQDDPISKPSSMVADFRQIPQALHSALQGKQLQPVII